MNVVLTAQSGQQPALAAQPATPSLTRAALEMLAAQAGKTLAGTVLGQAQNGLTELRLGGVTLAVRLSPQLPPGLPVRVTIVPSTQGPPTLSVQPLPTVATVPQTLAATPSSPPTPSPGVAPVVRAAVPTAPVATAPASPPSGPVATPRAPATAPVPPIGAGKSSGQPSAPQAANSPAAAGAQQAAPPPVAAPASAHAPAPSGSATPAGPAAPAASVGQAPAGGNGPVAAPPQPTAQSPASMPVAHSTAQARPAQSASLAAPGISTAASPPAAAAAQSSAPAAPSAAGSSPVLKPAAVPLAASLRQPAQAAARQDSILPLLQNLAVLSLRAVKLPAPVAEAATRLLAHRVPLDRGAPSADALRSAVTRAGVASLPSAGTSNADVKSALLQLRAGLLAMLGDGEVTPVAPVERRPAPPMRAAQPHGLRAEAPTLAEAASGREAARTLLGQTDSALSRLKLTQLASQPTEARPGAAAPALDLTIEIPMMLGHELSLAQLQVQRDGKSKARPGERGWRLRFAVNFSVVGEVGAQVSLLGGATSVMLWAAEEETAAALQEMLPDLGAALAARGLEVGAVRLRRGIPLDAGAPSGQLMDRVR